MFQGGRLDLQAGSWILDMMGSPSSPPFPSVDTVSTLAMYRSESSGRFRADAQNGFAASQRDGSEPSAANGAAGTVQMHKFEAPLSCDGSCCIADIIAAVRCKRTQLSQRRAAERDQADLSTCEKNEAQRPSEKGSRFLGLLARCNKNPGTGRSTAQHVRSPTSAAQLSERSKPNENPQRPCSDV